MLVYAGLPSYDAWEFVDIPDRYVFDMCDCICLLFAISLESFLSLTWRESESNPASELTCLRATKCIPLYKEFTR